MRLYRRGKVWWVSYFDHGSGETRRTSTRCTDRTAADAIGRQLERDGADPDGQAAATTTLAGALDAVIAEYEARMREKQSASATVEFYRKRAGQVLRMVASGVMPTMLSDLRARHVDALIDQRRAEGTSRATIAKDLIVLRIALKLAKRRGQWRGDVDEVMPVGFSPEYKPRERVLSPAELWALLAELSPVRAAWVAFAVATGANHSETEKATAQDVRLEHCWSTARVHLRGTKRELRDRMVPIVYPWQRALLGAVWSVANKGRMFATWANVNRDLKEAAKRAGIAPLSTNDLRRTFGTWTRASGAGLDLLAAAMGHIDSRMVERVYARLDVSQLAALLAPRAVSNLYVDPARAADKTDSAHRERSADLADSGSDCWTRTSDPVINSRRVSLREETAIGGACAGGVHPELPGLVRAVRGLAVEWDAMERMLEEDTGS